MPSAFLAAVIAATACGGGSPASPTFSPTTASLGDDAGSSPSFPDDASLEAIAAAFARCAAPPATGSLPPDVAAVLRGKCQTCHAKPPVHDAPFPLLEYADVHASLNATTTPIYEEMYVLIQPDGSPHMPFGDAPQLTTGEFKTLSDWLISCAPSGG